MKELDKKEAIKVSTQEEWDYVVDKLGFEGFKEPCHQFEGYERYLRLDTFGYNHTFDFYQEIGYTLITLEEFKSRYKPTLKIGDTFEHEGFICEVKEPIKKWHVVDRGLDAYYIRLSEDEVLWGRADDMRVEEITDEEFIKQLEKHAR